MWLQTQSHVIQETECHPIDVGHAMECQCVRLSPCQLMLLEHELTHLWCGEATPDDVFEKLQVPQMDLWP